VPRLAAEWDLDHRGERWFDLEATACLVDISGFTTVSERLARLGPLGAEQLTELLDRVFSQMLAVAYEKGGTLLKFGGDALLLAFARDDHPRLAAEAAVGMRTALADARGTTDLGRVSLRASMGLHTGTLRLLRAGGANRELLVVGRDCSATIELQRLARPGEILVSDATADRLPRGATADGDGGRRLRTRRTTSGGPGHLLARDVPDEEIEAWVPVRLRARLIERAGESEHRAVTVAFVRYTGVDGLLDADRGDDAADALDEVVRAVQDAAEAESVTLLGSDVDVDGGKLILVAGVPVTQEDDEGRVLRAARTIATRPHRLQVRVGVNRGNVFAGDVGAPFRRTFTIMGDTVNVAARLTGVAGPGEVCATAGVLERSRTVFDASELGPMSVKGRRDPVPSWSVGAPLGARHRTRGTLPFRGRDGELTRLVGALGAADDGAGSVVVIEGERGAGKTRLVTELVERSNDARVLQLRGESFSGAVPYLPFRPVVREVLGVTGDDRGDAGRQLEDAVRAAVPRLAAFAPLLAPIVDADVAATPETSVLSERFVGARTADLLVAVLEATTSSPLLIVVEDVHWFDVASGELVVALGTASVARPWLVCLTRRPVAGGLVPPDGWERLLLGSLDDDAVRELVDAATIDAPLRPQHRDSIVAKAAGNALFVEELLRLDVASPGALPDSLDAIAMREIDDLVPDARRLVLVGSVLGQVVDPVLLRALADAPRFEDGVGALGDVLSDDGSGQLRFRHALLQEAAYASLPFRTRLDLHRRAGHAIESARGDGADTSAMLSLHFYAAQDWERTWRYGRLAADASRRAHAPGEVLTHLERAATAGGHLDTVSDGVVASVLEEIGDAAIVVGDYDHADAAFRRASGAWHGDTVARARLAERRAYLRSEYQGRLGAAIRQVHTGVALLEGAPDTHHGATRVRASLLAREADVRTRQGRLTQAVGLATSAAAAADEAGDERTVALALSLLDQALTEAGRPDEAVHLPRALEIYERLGELDLAAMTLGNLGSLAYWRWAWDDAGESYTRAAAAATASGDLATAAVANVNLGELRVDQGRADEAVALLTPALRTLTAFGYVAAAGAARVHLGRARAVAGDPGAGVQLLRDTVAEFDGAGFGFPALDARAKLCEVLVLAGDTKAACVELVEARRAERALGTSAFAALLDRVEVVIEIATGERDEAAARLTGAIERARALGATYDLCVLLSLADRLGEEGGTEAASLARSLGVVTVPSLAGL
jgi:class 3 adenylate cyclase/tetratricopeptide (TPR) repeat protein